MAYSPWGCKESDRTERLSIHTYGFIGVFIKAKIEPQNKFRKVPQNVNSGSLGGRNMVDFYFFYVLCYIF